MKKKFDFDNNPVREAFRAGNRARKKESAQDAVESVDSIQMQIDLFKEQTGKELEIREGHPYYNGNLYLIGCTGLTNLPVGLKVKETLSLISCTRLTNLPTDLKVGGDLWLEGCTRLTSLPAGLEVGGDLWMEGCTGLTSLPSDLVVQGKWIVHHGILTPFFRKLGIRVDKNGDTKAEDWREWQRTHGYLTEAFKAGNRARKKESAQDTVESIDHIQAQIDLFKKQTGTELEIREGHPYYDGDLWLRYCTKLTSLPAGLEVERGLWLNGCTGLTSLPNGLEVGWNLDLEGCTKLTGLPDELKVGGDLHLEGCTGLTGLPSDIIVQGDWIVHKGVLSSFFRKLGIPVDRDGDTYALYWREWQKAHGYLKEAFRAGNRARKKESVQDTVESVDSMQTQINLFKEQTGKELEIRDGRPYFDGVLLYLGDCTRLTSLPTNLKVRGDLWLTGCTGLTSLPDGLEVGGDLWLEGCTGLKSLPFDSVIGDKYNYYIRHNGILKSFFRKLKIPVDSKGNTRASDWRKWQEANGYLKEAFRAGNRARKKESAQDIVQDVEIDRMPVWSGTSHETFEDMHSILMDIDLSTKRISTDDSIYYQEFFKNGKKKPFESFSVAVFDAGCCIDFYLEDDIISMTALPIGKGVMTLFSPSPGYRETHRPYIESNMGHPQWKVDPELWTELLSWIDKHEVL